MSSVKTSTLINDIIYYPELLENSKWGNDVILITNDSDLLENTNFKDDGFIVLDIKDFHEDLVLFLKRKISHIINNSIRLEDYHTTVSEHQHSDILNSMPYKRNNDKFTIDLCSYLEFKISKTLNRRVKIFNDDIWIRICRPTIKFPNDFNPCHRDVYLDFYKNLVNIYLPISGSNEKSSLNISPGSHKWNENKTRVTSGGAHFKSINKKYSVDAIVSSKVPLNMIKPNPSLNQIILFSPYLIHGCSNNDNSDITRFSLEIRFISDNENGKFQEQQFRDFLNTRTWR
jgi:ectoine hydroxylase-related dioxygenase (phytanoyl-CoA dioxygenase family)